jgi:hypothetical protein
VLKNRVRQPAAPARGGHLGQHVCRPEHGHGSYQPFTFQALRSLLGGLAATQTGKH